MVNYSSIGWNTKNDIDQAYDEYMINHYEERTTSLIKELNELLPYIALRKEHIKNHIVKKYYVSVWKHTKGTYRPTNDKYESTSICGEISGSHYAVTVWEYTFDKSLIGTTRKAVFEQDRTIITVPMVKSEYDYQKSKQFSWKDKKIAMQYAEMLCDKYGMKLMDASQFPDSIVNDGCLFVTAEHNNAGDVWRV